MCLLGTTDISCPQKAVLRGFRHRPLWFYSWFYSKGLILLEIVVFTKPAIILLFIQCETFDCIMNITSILNVV